MNAGGFDPVTALAQAQAITSGVNSGADYRQCIVSVLDTRDDPQMRFDEEGRSHYYHEYLDAERRFVRTGEEAARLMDQMVADIQADGKGKPYNVLIGVSGGVDSTYLALLVKELGLRPLVVHFDNGWNSELAVQNVENIISRLGFDLYTYVVNWEEFRDIQLSYLKASVVDIEAITDHAILATMYRLANKHGIRHVVSGTNVVTEQTLPRHWVFNKSDHVNVQAIHAAYGTIPLKTFPLLSSWTKRRLLTSGRLQSHSPLNWVTYDKARVKQRIIDELGWRDYGGKHYESIWTRFYQGYILPRKFGIDKRKAHLSNLIFSGQITKDYAIEELEKPIYPSELLHQDYVFVLKKLGFSVEDFESIMSLAPRLHTEFDTEQAFADRYPVFRPVLRALGRF